METSRAPRLTREISRGFLETGKVEKVAQRICSEHTEGVLVLSETMVVSDTTFVHVLVCSWHPSPSGLIMLRVERRCLRHPDLRLEMGEGSVTSSSSEVIGHLYLIFRLESIKVDIRILQNPEA